MLKSACVLLTAFFLTGCGANADVENPQPSEILDQQKQPLLSSHAFSVSGSGTQSTGKSTSTHFCWIGGFQGRMQSINDRISLDTSSGTWTLTHALPQSSTVYVYCAAWSDVGATTAQGGFYSEASGSVYWCGFPPAPTCVSQGQDNDNMVSDVSTNFCYNSGYAGEFDGAGEFTDIDQNGTNIVNRALAYTRVGTWAVCVSTTHQRKTGLFSASGGSTSNMGTFNDRVCYMRSVGGSMLSSSDGWLIWWESNQWKISAWGGAQASGSCHSL